MTFKIGTRGSPLALTQTRWVAEMLEGAHPGLTVQIVPIVTTGDRHANAPFSQLGTKGIFVKEIEDALLAKEIDLAIHSMKDVPQDLPRGLRLGPTPKREDPRDAVVSRFGELLNELPKNSIIGTSSPRRKAQILFKHRKRGYRFEEVRGNVDTRLRKLREGQVDAILLAAAGLKRLGLEGEATEYLEPEDMLPAPCQGCLALELRDSDEKTLVLLDAIKDSDSNTVACAERALLQGLGGNCAVPLGAFSKIHDGELRMRAIVLDVKGERAVSAEQAGPAHAPQLVGGQLAERLLHDGASELLFDPGEIPAP